MGKKLINKSKRSPASLIVRLFIVSLVLFILILNINSIIAPSHTAQDIRQSTQIFPAVNVCCEKTKSGAWCQNTKEDQCDPNFRKTPTSCDATSYCKLGICVDSEEGLCMENTPQKVCEISKGTWIDDSTDQIPQCNLGCCFIGNQASFVTLTRCKRLSNLYGLNTDYRTDIPDEATCILSAYSGDKGACVFESEGSKNCKMTTRGDCLKQGESSGNSTKTEFFDGYLCSADELATNCAPTKETICVEGRDEVYFKDSCGNPANIYDANKIYSKDPSYWQKIISKQESCNQKAANGNAESKTCGNCNYLTGSICKKGKATFGNFICKDINCYNTKNGKNYRNGESWCIYQSEIGEGQDLAGSRHFRHVCINGEETIEPCADFRNEVCISDQFDTAQGNFREAACRINRWTDCIDQIERDDCENTDKRDCYWVDGIQYTGAGKKSGVGAQTGQPNPAPKSSTNPATPINVGESSNQENLGIVKGEGICLPNYPPGLEFWKDSNAKAICSLGNSRQIVKFEEGLLGSKKCKENCEVLSGGWVQSMNRICNSLGDCGNKANIVGIETDDGIIVRDNGKMRKISQGIAKAVLPEEKGFFKRIFG